MGLWDKLKGEIIDIIDWTDNTNDTIVYKFPRFQNEIKTGAKLTVRESQVAVFMNEGQIADVFQPGMYELTTQNMPILSTLKGWKYGFNSPFKVDVFFVNTKQFMDQKWGTKNPIPLESIKYGLFEIRGFGTFTFRVVDAAKFLKEFVGTRELFSTIDVSDQLRSVIVSKFTDIMGEENFPIEKLASKLNEVGDLVLEKMNSYFSQEGLTISRFNVENISIPDDIKQRIYADSRAYSQLDANRLSALNMADAIKDAANNQGLGGAGIGMGVGMGMGNMVSNMMNQNMANTGMNTPPPPPPVSQFFVAVNGAQTGPFSIQQLQAMAMSGQFNRQSLVWKQGMAGWLAAETQAELTAVFGAIPPPPPPPIG